MNFLHSGVLCLSYGREGHACFSSWDSFLFELFIVCIARVLYLNLSRPRSFLCLQLLQSMTVFIQVVKYNHKINRFVLECITHVY